MMTYLEQGKLKAEKKLNGHRDFDAESVYSLLNKGVKRKTVIYGRVSTHKQKQDLERQIEMLKQFCFERGYTIAYIYQDVASGISFERRNDLMKLLDEVYTGKIERVVVSYKDRLSRVGFGLFKHLFDKYHCEIVVMSEVGSVKLDSEEIFEEIISLLHCYETLHQKARPTKDKGGDNRCWRCGHSRR
jgi:predicted site-specific integrase-resolvase